MAYPEIFDVTPETLSPANGKLVSVVGTPSDGQVPTWVAANSRYEPQTPSGGGGGGTTYPAEYDVRKKDVSPTAETDEFSSASITGWTDVQWSGVTEDQHTTQPGALWVRDASASTRRWRLKAMPAGDGRIYTMVSLASTLTNFALAGLAITDGTTAGAGNQAIFFVGAHSTISGSGWTVGIQTEQNFNGTSAALTGHTFSGLPAANLRITRSGSTYTFGFSPVYSGGRIWKDLTVSPGFTATHMGLFLFNSTGGAVEMAWEFFRYYASASALTGGAP